LIHPSSVIRDPSSVNDDSELFIFCSFSGKGFISYFFILRQNQQLFQQQKQQQQQRRRDIRHNGTQNNDVLHTGLNCYVQYQSIHQNVMLSAAFLMVMLSVQLFLVSEY
jgi:hypothetical protein